jgi:hypothetical protein
MMMRRSRKYNAWATEEGGVGQAAVGETHETAYADLPPICVQPKGKLFSATIFERSQLTQIWSKLFEIGTVGRDFSMHIKQINSEAPKSVNRFL